MVGQKSSMSLIGAVQRVLAKPLRVAGSGLCHSFERWPDRRGVTAADLDTLQLCCAVLQMLLQKQTSLILFARWRDLNLPVGSSPD